MDHNFYGLYHIVEILVDQRVDLNLKIIVDIL